MGEAARDYPKKFTWADMQHWPEWPEGERWELIDGEPVSMSPAPGRLHQEIVGNLFSQLHSSLKDHHCRVYVAPFDVRLTQAGQSADETDTVVQPDIVVYCDRQNLDERGGVGPPDLIIEVISPSTALRDNITKLKLYERFAVPEYWIVHPVDRLLFQRVLEQGPAGLRYGIPRVYAPTDMVVCEAVSGVQVDLQLVFEQQEQQLLSGPGEQSPPDQS